MIITDKVVVSIGGSILIPGNDDSRYILKLASMLKDISKEVQIVIVCGGGRIARYYADIGKNIGGSTYQLDKIGIGVTRLNAQLLSLAFGDMLDHISTTIEETANMSLPGKITIMGGTEPGHTTDAVASMVAKIIGANRIVNATSIDGVYTSDPHKNKNATKIKSMTIDELKDIVYKEHSASRSSVFDPLGVLLAKKNHIDIFIVDGRNIEEIRSAILGRGIMGTFVNSH